MSYEVDVAGLYTMTIAGNIEQLGPPIPNQAASVELYWNPDIGPGQWFRPALHITPYRVAPDGTPINPPGTAVAITSEGPMIDENLSTGLGLTATNDTAPVAVGATPIAEVVINVLSCPSHF